MEEEVNIYELSEMEEVNAKEKKKEKKAEDQGGTQS